MAKKTVIKRLLKYAPLKTEFAQAISNDEQNKTIEFTEDNQIIVLDEEVEVLENLEENQDNNENIMENIEVVENE